jgi:hypothetical protein
MNVRIGHLPTFSPHFADNVALVLLEEASTIRKTFFYRKTYAVAAIASQLMPFGAKGNQLATS